MRAMKNNITYEAERWLVLAHVIGSRMPKKCGVAFDLLAKSSMTATCELAFGLFVEGS